MTATANGYGNSKWAGEVLLREANDLCGLPVAVFRCDMILADTTYAGQLNVSDMFTRMVLSLVATGIAPGSFYQLDADGNRQRAHFDGLPVGFVAEAIATLGAQVVDGFETYHVMNPHDDGIGLDEYVDWLIEAGYPIQRIGDFGEWLQRFETALRALPDRQRQHSVLEVLQLLLHNSNRFAARRADPRVLGADRPIPCCGARSENRPRQRHPARLGADHHQIRHRLATARTALARLRNSNPHSRKFSACFSMSCMQSSWNFNLCVDVAVEDPVAALAKATGTMADVVVNVTAKAPTAFTQAIALARLAGTDVVAGTRGFGTGAPGFSPDMVVFKELRVIGALGVDVTAYRAALDLLMSGRYPFESLPRRCVRLEDAEELLATMAGERDVVPPVHGVLTP